MSKSYNLKLELSDLDSSCYFRGLASFTSIDKQVETNIEAFKNDDGTLNASKIKANWFPEVKSDAFISHSHNNKELAISFSWWLKETFGLNSFIDSCVWGHADKLLKIIDNEYCRKPGETTYSYEKRNLTTSHVHMMLSTALAKMMYQSKRIFFLNTPRSICIDDVVHNQTYSPWIYSEIAMSKLIHDRARLQKSQERALDEGLLVKYDLDLSHMEHINFKNLEDKAMSFKSSDKKNCLDFL